MSSDNIVKIRFQKLLKIRSEKERARIKTEMMHLNIINEISLLMEKNSMNKKQLAKRLNISRRDITRLFTGDKIISITLLTRIQDIFSVSFNVKVTDNLR